MNGKLVWLVIPCCAIALILLSRSNKVRAQSTISKAANENSLSTAEQDVLNEINQLRAHPEVYVPYLEGLKPLFKGKEYRQGGGAALSTSEGWAAVEDAIRFLRSTKPQGPLGVSPGLCLAASSHVKDQGATGATGHKGANSAFIEERVKPFGIWQGGIGENLSYGRESARERVLTWLIDDGFASRGHRIRMLSGDYKVAGLSCGPHPEFGTMCAMTLAGGFSDFNLAKASAVGPTRPSSATNNKMSSNKSKRTKRSG